VELSYATAIVLIHSDAKNISLWARHGGVQTLFGVLTRYVQSNGTVISTTAKTDLQYFDVSLTTHIMSAFLNIFLVEGKNSTTLRSCVGFVTVVRRIGNMLSANPEALDIIEKFNGSKN
jgi:uncharacterized membrane protein